MQDPSRRFAVFCRKEAVTTDSIWTVHLLDIKAERQHLHPRHYLNLRRIGSWMVYRWMVYRQKRFEF